MSKQGHLSNERAQDRMRQRIRLKEHQVAEDLKVIMSLYPGRRFLWDLIDNRCGLSSDPYTGETNSTMYSAGRRSLGVELLNLVREHCPDEWTQGFVEACAALKEDQLTRKDAQAQAEREEDDNT